MSYQPIVPFSGYAGWKVLNRTLETQKAAFESSSNIQKDEEYFREKISKVDNVETLVSDYRLLKVALGAFGLDDDISNKFFIRKVLEEGTLDDKSLANKLSDSRYKELSEAFGFDLDPPNTKLSTFADEISQKYKTRQFEISVGNADQNFRFSLNIQRELPQIASKDSSENTKWFTIIGKEALAKPIRMGLGLPESVAALDLDQQLKIYKDKADQVFGSSDPALFQHPENVEKLIKYYLLREQVSSYSSSTTGAKTALTLLQNASRFSARF